MKLKRVTIDKCDLCGAKAVAGAKDMTNGDTGLCLTCDRRENEYAISTYRHYGEEYEGMLDSALTWRRAIAKLLSGAKEVEVKFKNYLGERTE